MMFTLGSFYGWFAHAMLGALIVGFITIAVNVERARVLRIAITTVIGFGLGGFLGWISDATSDRLMIRMIESNDSFAQMFVAPLFWNFAVAMSMALGVALCCYPTWARFARVMLGGLAAAILGFITRMVLEPIFAVIAVAHAGMNGAAVQVWRPYDPSRLADDAVMGIVLGLSIGFAEVLMTSGSLRLVLGRNEGRDFRLGSGANRIGSAEGIEVPIFDRALAPVHAIVWRRGGQFSFEDVSRQGGAFVNGYPAGRAALRPGDVIQIAGHCLVFSPGGQAPYEYVSVNPESARRMAMPAAAPPPPPATLSLEDSMGEFHTLAPGATIIGRDAAADIALTWEPTISRRHAEIVVSDAGCSVTDLGSSNGTFVNGVALTGRQPLQAGDELRLGKCVLRVR